MKAVLSQSIRDITVATGSSQPNIYWWIHTCQNLGVKRAEIDEEVLSLLPGTFWLPLQDKFLFDLGEECMWLA